MSIILKLTKSLKIMGLLDRFSCPLVTLKSLCESYETDLILNFDLNGWFFKNKEIIKIFLDSNV